MDGWVEKKKKRKKTDRNRGPDEVLDVDEMLDEIDAEDPPDYDEIERLLESPEPEGPLRRLEQEYGDLSRFTPSEVEDLMMGCSTSEPGDQEPKSFEPGDQVEDLMMGCSTSEPGDQEPKSFEPGDQEPKSFEPGDREPKSFEPGDHEPKSSEPGDREPPVDPTAKEEPGLGTSKDKKAKQARVQDNEEKQNGEEAPQEPNKSFAGRLMPQTQPFRWRFQFAVEAFQQCPD
ncbi:unnamed protein product [Symbiodinium necroappetens]|uniref:Uncharacterized protein n=1 Tax=Symbiodinium necroappetens TaxID=1628268 RepID=A0A813A0N4_9DINO|nr:unnamed protein product [Symbiodinium necroappetens]